MDNFDDYRRIRRDRSARKKTDPEALLAAYLSLRQSLSFRTKKPGFTLRQFLKFVRGRGVISLDKVDRELAETWLRSGSVRQGTVTHRLMAARGFFRYLLHLGVVKENVWDFFPTPRRGHFIPYIFTLDELRAVFGFLREHDKRPRRRHMKAACLAVFHTLYACGLRIGEVCRLDIGDADLEESILTIRATKFGKTRLVPFNPRTHEILDHYFREVRPRDAGSGPEATFFLNWHRRRLKDMRLWKHFRLACRKAGVWRPKRTEGNTVYGGTTPHALRHTFAVHRLLKWYEEGADVNAKLPHLATYMGHVDYHMTQQYLTVLPRFTDIAGDLFSRKFERPLGELE